MLLNNFFTNLQVVLFSLESGISTRMSRKLILICYYKNFRLNLVTHYYTLKIGFQEHDFIIFIEITISMECMITII